MKPPLEYGDIVRLPDYTDTYFVRVGSDGTPYVIVERAGGGGLERELYEGVPFEYAADKMTETAVEHETEARRLRDKLAVLAEGTT